MGVGIGVSGFVSNSLGNPLVVVPPKVNLVGSDNRDDVLEGSKALVHEEADRVLEDVSPVGWSASKEDICVNSPRDSEKVGSRAAGLACLGADLVPGPNRVQPMALRTKGGDIPLSSNLGGVNSSVALNVDKSTSVQDGIGPNSFEVQAQCGGSLPDNLLCPNISDKGNGGRCKKGTRKHTSFLPYDKFTKYHNVVIRKKKQRKIPKKGEADCVQESDPIQSTDERPQLPQGVDRQEFRDLNGIGLEVVLSHSPEGVVDSVSSTVQGSRRGRGGLGGSGLEELLGEEVTQNPNMPSNMAIVDKDTGDVHHIIDIQEDIEMTFNEIGEEDVKHSLKCEVRDREEKLVWVQGHSDQ
ncbi:hypothetical protein P8452_18828 [Trifolium repens]|nr:hypothetical protein P8452_18828 [Trifolium repens]